MQIIPFRDDASFHEQVQIDGQIYVFNFHWNSLNEFWVMDIYNRDEEPIIIGIKIVANYPLLYPFAVDGMPEGEIICQNILNEDDVIRRFDMSQKFELIYFTRAEVDALQ